MQHWNANSSRVATAVAPAGSGIGARPVNAGMAAALLALLCMVLGSTPGLIPALSDLQASLPTVHAAHASAAHKAAPRHAFQPSGDGTFTWSNKVAGLSGSVSATGLRVRSSASAAPVSLRSLALGRAGAMRALAAATPTATDETAALRHGGVIEWFQNRAGSLEQGWTIARRPAGAGSLRLVLGVTGAKVLTTGSSALTLVPSVGVPMSYANLLVRDAGGHRLPAHFTLTPRGARIVVDDAGARYPVVIDPDLTVVGSMVSPQSANGNQFGSDVAVDGTWMVVKEPGARVDPTSSVRPGRIAVYHDSTGNGSWQLVDHPSMSGNGTQTVSNSGVGVLVEPAGVTVFTVLTNGSITVGTYAGDPDTVAPSSPGVARPTITGVVPSGAFLGATGPIDVDGNLLAIGYPQAGDQGVRTLNPDGSVGAPSENIGTVEVFRRTGGFGTGYAFETRLDPPGGITQPAANRDILQLFGTSLSVDASNGLVAVGAPGDDGVQTHTGGTIASPAPFGTTTSEGAVDVFRNTAGTTWSQVSRFTSSPTVAGAKFGTSLGLAPTGSIVVGAPNETVATVTNVGAGYLFDKASGSDAWTQVQRILPDDPTTGANEAVGNSQMGTRSAISPSGNQVYFSAPNQTIATGRTGSVYTWTRSGNGTATYAARLVPNTASDQHGGLSSGFGNALSVNNNVVVVGAPNFGTANETLVGEVTTFRRSGTAYSLAGELTPQTVSTPDAYGTAIAQDGDVLAVGLPNSNRGSGFGKGAVAVYHRSGGSWVFEQMLFPYSNDSVNGGTWGASLAIHATRNSSGADVGLTVAVGDRLDSTFDPDGNQSAATATTVTNGGSVAIFGRDGGPGTTYAAGYKIWAGGRSSSSPSGDISQVTSGGQFGTTVAFTADGTLVVGEPGAGAGGVGRLHRYDKASPSTSVANYLFRETVLGQASDRGLGTALDADGTSVLAAPANGNGLVRYTDGGPTTNLTLSDRYPMNLGDGGSAAPMDLSLVGSRFAVSGIDPSNGQERVRVYRVVGGVPVREADVRPASGFTGRSLDLNHGGSVLTLIVGTDQPGGSPEGGDTSVYVAKVKSDGSGQWSKFGNLIIPAGVAAPDSAFGYAVSNWPSYGGVLVGAPGVDATGINTGGVYVYNTASVAAPLGPQAYVDVSLPSSIQVGATKVRTSVLPSSLLTAKAATSGSIASTAIGSLDLSVPSPGSTTVAAPLSSIPLKSIPLKSIPLKSIPLSSIPLKSIGGWEVVLAGTPYAGLPLQDVMLSDVYNLDPVQNLTLGALDLAGSPLKSIPLASIALGSTPLKSIDIDPTQTGDPIAEWCSALTAAKADTSALGLNCSNPSAASNDAVTVLSIGLKGAPLDALPLKSIPLKSIDLSALPLKSIPLKSIGIANTPLKSIPLKSIDLGSTPLKSIPLKSIPLKSIPLKSIPLSSITLGGTPLKSIPLKSIDISSTPLKSIPLKSIPLSSISLNGTPLKSIPLKSIPLKSIPLKSIPLSSIMLGGTPLKSIPLSSIDLGATPLKSIPLKSIPLSSIPLSSIPLKSIPLKSIPLKSIPLSSITIGGTPLKSIPLKSINIGATPLKSIPLKSIGTGQLATLVDCSTFDCTAPGATLADAAQAGAVKPGATIDDLGALITGLRLSDLIGAGADPAHPLTADQLNNALTTLTLADVSDFDDLQLGELSQVWPYLTLEQVQALSAGIRLGDVASHLLEYTSAQVVAALNNTALTLNDVSDWDTVTLNDWVNVVTPGGTDLLSFIKIDDLSGALGGIRLGDLAGAINDGTGHRYSEAELRTAMENVLGSSAALSALTDFDDVTLGELGNYCDPAVGDPTNVSCSATMGDLLGALSDSAKGNLTLADLLLAMISPKQYPWEKLDLSQVTTQALDDTPNGSPVTLAYRADAPDGLARTEQVTVQLPHGSRIDLSSITGDATAADRVPVVVGDTATWTISNVPANAVQQLAFTLDAPLTIGPAQVQATAFLPADDATATDSAGTVVREAFEPNDTIAGATPLADDTITLSHISQAGDIDVYKFDVTDPGTRVTISLSNLDADLDAVLYGPRDGTIVATSNRSLDPVEDQGDSGLPAARQQGAVTTQSTTGNDQAAPTDLGNLAAVQGSFNRGRSDEQIDTGVLTKTGTYYVAVTGYNAAVDTEPYALRLKRFVSHDAPSCPSRAVTPGTFGTQLPSSLPSGTNTVFVLNRSRMAGLYGAAATDTLMNQLNDFVTWANGDAAVGVKAAVLTVDADSAVRSAYAQWDASPCLPAGANAVVSEVGRILNGYRTQGSELTNVVLVGGDDAVPFARVPDRTKVANESGYATTFSDAGNALYATFATSSLQTDNAYVDRDPYAFGDRSLYVPDTTVARMVESPAEIGDQLTDFQNADGKLAVGTGLVTGYDFLSDGARAVKNEASKTFGSVDSHLISDTWTRQDLEDAIHAIKPDLLSINSHFDHYRALPGAGNTTNDESDLFTAAAVRGALNGDLAGSVVFSMGCHSGLSASDQLLGGGDERALDFAQAVSSQGGVFVGNTGFGYGDTDTVALSEQLMKEYAERLNGSMTVGAALLYAKNAYFSGLAEFTPYDEKVLEETTFYGLPFYRLDVPNPPALVAPVSPVLTPDSSTGLDAATTHLAPTYATRTASNGTTYVAAVDPTTGEDGLTTVQNRPVEPKVDTEYALPAGRESHDALVLGLTSVDTPNSDPYLFSPTVDSAGEREDVGVDTAFPTKAVQVNPGLTPSGATFHVASTTGYFRTTSADGKGLQRTYKSMDVQTYLAPAGSTDFVAPTFSQVTGQVHDGVLSISAHVLDDRGDATRIKRVRMLLLQDPAAGVATTWRGLDLVRTAGSDEWTGSLPTSGRNLEFVLQAVDAVGNVGVTTDKAANFTDDAVVAGAVTNDDSTQGNGTADPLVVTLAGPQGGEGWYQGPVTVTATGGIRLVYEVVGESDPAGYQQPFSVTGTGLHSVRVSSGDGQAQTVTIPIDTVGPVATLTSPAPGQSMPAAPGALINFSCPDAGSGATTCSAKLDGNPVTSGTTVPLAPGQHTVVVTAGPDRAGNPASVPTVSRTFTVLGAPATVGSIGISKAQDGAVTTLTVPFTGYSVLTYSGSVTWGDGGTTNCAMAGSGCTITRDSSGGGVLTVTHTYNTSWVDTNATVTVIDNLGQTASAMTKVNRKTTLTATPALLQLKVGTSIVELKSGAISATLKDATGNPLPNQTVKFTFAGGSSICTATTNMSGTATCPSNILYTAAMILAGKYTATFPGKDAYHGSTATATLIGPA